MIEKTPEGYGTFPGAIFWTDEFDEFHRKHGPAVMYDTGQYHWYVNGECIKSINIEDDDVQIKDLLKEINFKRIHSVMKLLDWKWGTGNTVPSVREIKAEAIRLLNGVKKYRTNELPNFIQCGGLKAYASMSGFRLEFILEQWDTE